MKQFDSRMSEECSMMKIFLVAFIALGNMTLLPPIQMQAQSLGQTAISDPAEFEIYRAATAQSDPIAKAEALQEFLKRYPQSTVRKAALEQLIDAYQAASNRDESPNADDHLLKLDPNDPRAIFLSTVIKKNMCSRTGNVKTCDDAAELAQKGLTVPRPATISDDDWKSLTAATYPVYHSALALDYMVSKKEVNTAIREYRTELMLYAVANTTKGQGLVDTLQLAEAYTNPDVRDLFMACWFYARGWNFAPPTYQAAIEPKLEYWYRSYHGSLEGLDELKANARATLFPPTDTREIVKPVPNHPD